MFIVVQFPLADLRPLIRGEMGRLPSPDWTADDPGEGFVRGFGKMATRNSQGYGLLGERAFADFNQAVRFREVLRYHQEGWRGSISAEIRFRRLYFDGRMAGRFEFGFIMNEGEEDLLCLGDEAFAYDPAELAAAILNGPVGVRSSDGAEDTARLEGCRDALGLAYINATTKQAALAKFPAVKTLGTAVSIGPPTVHMRAPNGRPVLVGRDKREVAVADGASAFITSATGAERRNTVFVQRSDRHTMDEAPQERAIRVLFAHLSALLHAHSHFLTVRDGLDLVDRPAFKAAVEDMLARFERFEPAGPPAENDKNFAMAIQAFASSHTGRVEELTKRLEDLASELSKPTTSERAATMAKAFLALVTTTAVEASVKLVGKGV